MRILGISSLKPDYAAALIENGAPMAAIESDKVARGEAHRQGAAIQSCLATAGVSWDSIDAIAIAAPPAKSGSRAKSSPRAGSTARFKPSEFAALTGDLARQAPERSPEVHSLDYHLCHAAGAFFASPFDRALIVIVSGGADGHAATIAVGEGDGIRVINAIPSPHSLARAFSEVTALIGFRPQREEHKTQWLSLEGEPLYKDVLLRALRAQGGTVPHLHRKFFNGGMASQLTFSDRFYRETGLPQDPKQFDESQRKALAASIQAACVEIIADLVEDLRQREGIQNVCFAGGLFQNVLLVAELEQRLGVEHVFVPPAPGNAGASLGAARLLWHQIMQNPRSDAAPHAYLGPKFDRHAIRDVLENSKNRYTFLSTEERKLETGVQLLLSGKIVAWFQGPAEFGPRALGNRSVLASPWAAYVKENLNDFIKHREWFRPFAVSVPEEDCDKYFVASPQCRFMNSLGTVRADADCLPESFLLPHRRVRLHVVERRTNPAFWSLLKRFGEQAPAPMLLNTSFNLFGEPLVVTPRDAMRSYFSSGLDALMMDRFVLSKAALPVAAPNLAVTRVGLGA